MEFQATYQHHEPAAFGRVAVLMGGTSSEREVSLQSGWGVYEALTAVGVNAFPLDLGASPVQQLQTLSMDRAFIALHGGTGEGGIVQAILEAMDIPFTGSDHAASALCMNKIQSKRIMQSVGLPTPNFHVLHDVGFTHFLKGVTAETFPLAIKPNRGGSTIGISRVFEQSELFAAYELAKQYDEEVLIEPWIQGTEYTVAILNEQVLPTIKIQPKGEIYDYEAKYLSDETAFFCPAGLEAQEEAYAQQIALDAYKALGCRGWARVDLIRESTGAFYIFEVNTVPGLTTHSLVPMAAKAVGLNYEAVVLEILKTSMYEEASNRYLEKTIASIVEGAI